MRINEAASHSGLSHDTIRFYEKSGMLPSIRRDARGWRIFSTDDVNWLTTLERLRVTGMPLDNVKRFAKSAHAPDCDSPAQQATRLALLEAHAETLANRRAELDACEAYLRHKIQIYRKRKDATDG